MAVQHKNLTHPSLKAFKQHGFNPLNESGSEQVVGRCVFCGSGRKASFYVNVETKKWDCKICHKNGGYQTWLKEIVAFSQKHFTGKVAADLSKDRHISINTLKQVGLGWNPVSRAFILPIPEMEGDKLHDVRFYKKGRFMTTSGCKTGLWGWENLSKGYSDIWLCEGEWDRMVMIEALQAAERYQEIPLSVPGSNVFKNEWQGLFKDLNVNTLYDNDKAGREGNAIVFNKIQGVATKLKFIQWKPIEKPKKDIRDIYKILKTRPKAFLRQIEKKLGDEPQLEKDSKIKVNTPKTIKYTWDGEGHEPQHVYDTYTKWLDLESTDVLDYLYGGLIANRLPGVPIWLMLVAQSGSTKSELIMSFDNVKNVTSISSLTTNTLISGMNVAGGGDASLIPKLDQGICSIKDLTNLLSMNVTHREEIFGQLRDAFDGKAAKPYGNGLFKKYNSMFGMLCGVTPVIEILIEGHSALGERFERWFIPEPRTVEAEACIVRTAMNNVVHSSEMQNDLSTCASETLNYDFKVIPSIDDNIQNKLISLAQWTALLRAAVPRDKYTREITHTPFKELATRLGQQYYKHTLGIGMFRRLEQVTEAEYSIMKHVALSTIPSKMMKAVKLMFTNIDKSWVTKDFEQYIGLPHNTCERVLEELHMLNIIKLGNRKKLKKEWIPSGKILKLTTGADLWQ